MEDEDSVNFLGGTNSDLVKKEDYNVAVTNAASVGEQLRTLQRKNNKTSRSVDACRRIVQLFSIVCIIIMIISLFVEHPSLKSPHKYPVVAGLSVVCLAYCVALEITKGHTSVILFLIMTGIGVASFTLGMLVERLKTRTV